MTAVRRGEARLRGPAAAAALAAHASRMVSLAGGAPIAAYWPIGDEIDPRPLLSRLQSLGMSLALPVVVARGQPLIFRRYRDGDRLEAGSHGTYQPSSACPDVRPGLVLTPLLAFDRRGFRLGYGGGYYDRTLDRLRRDGAVGAIGLAFAAQAVDRVPTDPLDQPLDAVVTETTWIEREAP